MNMICWKTRSPVSTVDFVLIDRNHAPSGNYYPEVRVDLGTEAIPIEWGTSSTTTYSGTYGPYTMTTSQVLRVWDSHLSAGVRKYFAIKPNSGDANLGITLFDSNPGSSATFYQGRSQYVDFADSNGSGGDEFMDYQTSTSDDMGLVVWNNGATTDTTFYLYADTNPPSGSISINNNDQYASSTSVTLNLSASDSHTGVAEMQFSNDGVNWNAWQPYGTTSSWTIPGGDGYKEVHTRYKNNAGMVSSAYMDAIVLDTSRSNRIDHHQQRRFLYRIGLRKPIHVFLRWVRLGGFFNENFARRTPLDQLDAGFYNKKCHSASWGWG